MRSGIGGIGKWRRRGREGDFLGLNTFSLAVEIWWKHSGGSNGG
jgi:hypothetical protein